ncbi:MAG TPA: aminopeptidase P N-terminal domain-containing protein [Longimicrobiales bacterium]|nr:aminopeptidase P N-terminal domain-containing protein [Longimicrobiales bacterium]
MRKVALPLLILVAACAPASSQTVSAGPAPATFDIALPAPEPVSAAEYAARRQALLRTMGDGVLAVFGAPPPAADYLPFVQLPDFRYLTGIMEPGAGYIAVKKGDRVEERLFVLPREPSREVWEGARLGPDGARARTGISAETNDRFFAVLDSLAGVHPTIHTTVVPPVRVSLGDEMTHAQQVITRLKQKYPSLQVAAAQGMIRTQRGAKSAAELDRIRRAVHISALAHREAMRSTMPGMNEFELRALMEFTFRRYGAEGPAYGSIVGSGPNSTTLHYQASDRFMNDGEVLLIDAAASYGGYAADITRTFPVNGRFTTEQRNIYEVVLAAQKAAAAQVRVGATWSDLNEAATTELRNGLARLGLIDAPDATYDCGTPSQVRKCPQLSLFYMHGLGHGVGLAVHDPDVSQSPAGFQHGSAVTIEPGLYIRADAFDYLRDSPDNRAMIQRLRAAHTRYTNIGVRVEDVFILTAAGVERPSSPAPREIAEIEALMAEPGLAQQGRMSDIVEWFRGNQGR